MDNDKLTSVGVLNILCAFGDTEENRHVTPPPEALKILTGLRDKFEDWKKDNSEFVGKNKQVIADRDEELAYVIKSYERMKNGENGFTDEDGEFIPKEDMEADVEAQIIWIEGNLSGTLEKAEKFLENQSRERE